MAYDQTYRGTLTFADRAAYDAVLTALVDEEGLDWEDSPISPDDLRFDGSTLTIDVDGSFPASFHEIGTWILAMLAAAAVAGHVTAIYDPGDGEPFVENFAAPV